MIAKSQNCLTEDCLTEDCLTESRSPENDSAIEIPKQGMPVTIITGFLGSGKTTLLNHILNNAQGLKVAVLVNEFGDINIDTQLLVSSDQTMVELSNGCICCTINESLVDAVYQVLEREERIDYLVIETTGLADPLPIMMTFVGTELKNLTRLDSVLGVVDAEAFGPAMLKHAVYANQLAYSDVILLNKTDLVSDEKAAAVEEDIHLLKSDARILSCSLQSSSDLPLSAILDVGLTDVETYALSERELSDHLVSDHFVSMPFRSDRPFDFTKFEHFLMQQLPENIFRAKGILWFQDQPHRYIFQLAGKRCSLSPDTKTRPTQNQLVFIGHKLNPLQIHQQLGNCLTG